MTGTAEIPGQEVSLLTIGRFLGRNIGIIGSCFLFFAVAAGALSFKISPRYRAEVTISPVTSSGNLGQISGELGSLAAFAGINLGGEGKKSEEALAYLRSRGFTGEFIQKHSLMPILYSGKWNAQTGQWRGDPPTVAQAVKLFQNVIRQISEDRRTGIVTLAIIWKDRELAAQWANMLVAEADAALRQRRIAEFGRSIEFLKQEASQAQDVEIRTAVFKVMESELKDQMVARTRDSYAFKILDPAVPPDAKDKDSPNKPLYVILGGAFGIFVGCVWALARRRRAGSGR